MQAVQMRLELPAIVSVATGPADGFFMHSLGLEHAGPYLRPS